MRNARENWIDHVKIFACVLVALGHFFQSMCAAGILNAGLVYQWFNRTIYYFHVPLFFICSGYLYQKYSKVDSLAAWKLHAVKKLLALGIPYFVFSLVTWGLKNGFSGEVNTQTHGLAYDLFIHPMSPYWYLFALFFIFLITPTFSGKRACCIGIVAAVFLKLLTAAVNCYAVEIVVRNQIWFVIGMAACVFDFSAFAEKHASHGWILAVIFVVLSVVMDWGLVSFAMGLLACAAVMLVSSKGMKFHNRLAAYTMPVFLMHTIFAAGVRAVLLKLGITDPAAHVILGLLASFAGPVIAAEVMKKLKLDILYQPGKYIKINK